MRNNYKKKRAYIIVSVLLLGMTTMGVLTISWKNENKVEPLKPSSLEVATKPEEQEIEKILDWKLVLVNKEHPLPEKYTISLSKIDENREFDIRAISYLQDMIEACRKNGNKGIWVQSSYRSIAIQKKLFANKVAQYQNKGYEKAQAEELAQKLVNKPGHSEHNLGLAVDFNTVDTDFEDTKAFNWLCNHAEEYGFILRYPKEKEDITKVTYEPWHWRYVGKENAKIMNEKNWCLEEYVAYLESKQDTI